MLQSDTQHQRLYLHNAEIVKRHAAPVVINEETVNVGVVVLFGDKHRPHSLRVLMPSGKEYVLQKIKADPEMKEASPKGAVRSSTGSANKATVAQSDSAVKYSDRASDGSQLSAKQQSFFRDSKVRDEQGRLPVMYHGTNTPGFTVFNPKKSDDGISLFFTDSVDVTDSYKESDGESCFRVTHSTSASICTMRK